MSYAIVSRHEEFCIAVASGMTAEQAYIQAGYSENGAAQSGSRLLRNANIRSRIRGLRKAMAEQAIAQAALTREYVITHLMTIVEQCMQQQSRSPGASGEAASREGGRTPGKSEDAASRTGVPPAHGKSGAPGEYGSPAAGGSPNRSYGTGGTSSGGNAGSTGGSIGGSGSGSGSATGSGAASGGASGR